METAQELIQANDYVVMTFSTTTRALKAEQALKSKQAIFVSIPTPREISTSCGISVKLHTHNKAAYEALLGDSGVDVAGIYRITGSGRNISLLELAREYRCPAC